jgi:GLPGLI family protein
MRKYTTLKILSLIFIIQIFPFQAFSQFFDQPYEILDSTKLMIIYKMSWKQDTNNLEHIRQENMILLVGKKMSMFMSYNFYKFNLIGRKAEREGNLDEFLNGPEIGNFKTRFTYKIYKNYPAGRITYTDKVMPAFLQYDEDLNTFKWQLTDLIDTIGDYIVHCAYTDYGGRHWIAWYTTEIPLNDGPYKFRGLPGLIIKLYDEQKHYVFEMVSMERTDEAMMIEYMDMDWVQTTRREFLKAQENFRLDIINRAKEAGVNSEGQQRALRSMLKRNNPIEF